jgi:hypothetical protein
MPMLAQTLNMFFNFPFPLQRGSTLIVYLPGFSNRLKSLATENSTKSFKQGSGFNTTFSSGLAWSTPFSWTAQWIEGFQYNQYTTSNFFISINRFPNGLSSQYGRFANYTQFSHQLLPPQDSSDYYSTPNTSFTFTNSIGSGCSALGDCNKHGICNVLSGSCDCFDGYGSVGDQNITDMNTFLPDCSSIACPVGYSFIPLATTSDIPYSQKFQYKECSNRGLCDRISGKCKCFENYEGIACDRMVCPGKPICSNQGLCKTLSQIVKGQVSPGFALPDRYHNASYNELVTLLMVESDNTRVCVCDSSWSVGYKAGETQQAEYFGPACEKRHCPSGNDPKTPNIDETDCYGKSVFEGGEVGQKGNKCHVDCANNGICDYRSGICSCFPGYGGINCAVLNGFITEVSIP